MTLPFNLTRAQRKWLYGVGFALVPISVALNKVTQEEGWLYLNLLAALLGFPIALDNLPPKSPDQIDDNE